MLAWCGCGLVLSDLDPNLRPPRKQHSKIGSRLAFEMALSQPTPGSSRPTNLSKVRMDVNLNSQIEGVLEPPKQPQPHMQLPRLGRRLQLPLAPHLLKLEPNHPTINLVAKAPTLCTPTTLQLRELARRSEANGRKHWLQCARQRRNRNPSKTDLPRPLPLRPSLSRWSKPDSKRCKSHRERWSLLTTLTRTRWAPRSINQSELESGETNS